VNPRFAQRNERATRLETAIARVIAEGKTSSFSRMRYARQPLIQRM